MNNLIATDDNAGVVLYKPGQNITGMVIDANPSRILVDLPGGMTGIITKKEQFTHEGAEAVEVGQEIEATIIDDEDEAGLVVLSLRKASQDKTWAELGRLMEEKTTVKAKVYEANKGGLMVRFKGLKGFVPVSQLTPEHYPRVGGANAAAILTELSKLVGLELVVRVINVDRERDKVIFSEKEAYAEEARKALAELSAGDTVNGRVSGVVKYGIFVEYKGVEGLVHLSELSWDHVPDAGRLYKVGDKVDVLVLSVDGDKLSFSIKRLSTDPWLAIAEQYDQGQIVTGKVTRWNDSGVFIQINDSVQGAFGLDEFGVDDHMDLRLREGQEMSGKILAVNTESHRLELARVSDDEA